MSSIVDVSRPRTCEHSCLSNCARRTALNSCMCSLACVTLHLHVGAYAGGTMGRTCQTSAAACHRRATATFVALGSAQRQPASSTDRIGPMFAQTAVTAMRLLGRRTPRRLQCFRGPARRSSGVGACVGLWRRFYNTYTLFA